MMKRKIDDIKEELTLVRAEKERKGLHEETIIVSQNEINGEKARRRSNAT